VEQLLHRFDEGVWCSIIGMTAEESGNSIKFGQFLHPSDDFRVFALYHEGSRKEKSLWIGLGFCTLVGCLTCAATGSGRIDEATGAFHKSAKP